MGENLLVGIIPSPEKTPPVGFPTKVIAES
jgi:hypothetical protein